MLHRLGDGRGARGDIQFIQNIGDVSVDRVLAQTERGCGLLVAQSLRHEAKDLQLPSRQASGSGLVSSVVGHGRFQTAEERLRARSLSDSPNPIHGAESCPKFPRSGINTPQGG